MTSSPLWRGGGRIFPNSPDENFAHKVNRKMYRAGIRSMLGELVRQILKCRLESKIFKDHGSHTVNDRTHHTEQAIAQPLNFAGRVLTFLRAI